MNAPAASGIRRARANDAPLLPDVERSAAKLFLQIPELAWIAGDTVQDEARHRELIAAGTEWVAVDAADRPVGFLSAAVEGDVLHVFELSVGFDHQRQGHGRALIAAALEDAERRGLAALTLTTFRDVDWNAPYYEKLGFAILPPSALDARLAGILATEALLGLPAERRCAMALRLAAES